MSISVSTPNPSDLSASGTRARASSYVARSDLRIPNIVMTSLASAPVMSSSCSVRAIGWRQDSRLIAESFSGALAPTRKEDDMKSRTKMAALVAGLAMAGGLGVATAVSAHPAGEPSRRGGMCGGGMMGPGGGHGGDMMGIHAL